jgi:Lrp/AsnC family transcriptional regulator for asnA, asnC and gidA
VNGLDELDIAILIELEEDARISFSELARRLEIPHTTIRDRIRRMEEAGVIEGYTTLINPEKIGLGIKAIAHVSRDPKVSLDGILSEPDNLTEITSLQVVTGETDELFTFYARNADDLKEIIYNRFATIPGIVRMSTTIVLDERRMPITARFRKHNNQDEEPPSQSPSRRDRMNKKHLRHQQEESS